MTTWTDQRVSRAKTMWNNGKSASAIASTLGETTRNAVISKLGREARNGWHSERPITPKKPDVKPGRSPVRKRIVPKGNNQNRQLIPAVPKVGQRAATHPLTSTAVSLLHLPFLGACKFPVGEATGAAQMFCGATVGSLYLRYCDDHCRIAYQQRRDAA